MRSRSFLPGEIAKLSNGIMFERHRIDVVLRRIRSKFYLIPHLLIVDLLIYEE